MNALVSADLKAHLYADERLLHAAIGRECSWLGAFLSWLGLLKVSTFIVAATTHRFLFIRVQSNSLRELAFEAMPWHELEGASLTQACLWTRLELRAHGQHWKHTIRVDRTSCAAAQGIVLVWADEHARPTTRRRSFVAVVEEPIAS